ncbi:hypothetical protein C2E23DRAFT_286011 [Lenzites betulinus]|nr:hypothetical protein C2E23DRAFT_286011 [Lenzites betulinus]
MCPSSPAASSDIEPPPPDESGEPEIDPDSPPSSPAHYDAPAGQRSSHPRKKKPGHIPRPPNAFMILRSHLWNKERIKSSVERDHRQISRIAGNLWNSLSDAERAPYHDLAEDAKKEHAKKYTQYKYSPIYRRDKPVKRKPKQDYTEKVLRCHEVAQLIQRGFEGDDLKNELDRRAAKVEDRPSGSSEYVPATRHRLPRSPAKRSSSKARPRRERRGRVKDDEVYLPAERHHPVVQSPVVKQEAFASRTAADPPYALQTGPTRTLRTQTPAKALRRRHDRRERRARARAAPRRAVRAARVPLLCPPARSSARACTCIISSVISRPRAGAGAGAGPVRRRPDVVLRETERRGRAPRARAVLVVRARARAQAAVRGARAARARAEAGGGGAAG